MIRRISLSVFLVCSTGFAQQLVTVPNEPANIDLVKIQLKKYQSCTDVNCYTPQLERQADLAIQFLKQSAASAKAGEKLSLILDIDETSLSNWNVETHDDLGYIANDWNWCVTLQCGKAIPATLRVFREAEKDKIAVFFITGRPEPQRTDTEANLKAAGYDQWQGLYLRPENHPKDQTTAQFKSGDRAKIVASGYRIVLNVGDQLSDLEGKPQAEHSVKLPNPFYLIP